MITFLSEVLQDLEKKKATLSELVFIVPSKRAGVVLKYELSKTTNKTFFSPKIIGIESFTEELSQIKSVSNTELLFEFYNIYLKLTPEKEQDSFEIFSKWAQILLQDFNEIDRYLIPQDKLFNYLSAIQDLKHWSLTENKTDFVKNYLSFWNKLNTIYSHFKEELLKKEIGYQGLIYREAVEQLESYVQNNETKKHVFIGFNALNSAEETIIQELLSNGLANVYWDIDSDFFNNKYHDAGLFIRRYKKNWRHYQKNSLNWISNNYSDDKHLTTYAIPKNIGQVKQIGSLLKSLLAKSESLENTAVVLADEDLLIPLLNSLPKGITKVNITMGLPLNNIPIASLFELLFSIHKKPIKSFYYKDVVSLLSNKFIRGLFIDDHASEIINTIVTNNIIYLTKEELKEVSHTDKNILEILFSNWDSPEASIAYCFELITLIKNRLKEFKSDNLLALEYLYRYNELFNELSRLNNTYRHINDIASLYAIYKELLSSETLDFQGEPLKGLQIMGMLESRVLDFKTVIIASVNEGILPSGKTNNSFIPFDVKIENGLPTYKEKDAVYTYHFYRLIQRAKNIHLLYNSEIDALKGGEKSRFITQLEIEGTHNIQHKIVAPKVPSINTQTTLIKKTNAVVDEIIQIAKKGFSPSSLTNYIRNPLDFYYQKILKIKQQDEVEETVAANTLGTVVHNTLEDCYKPLEGKNLTEDFIKQMKLKIEETVSKHFKNTYKEGDISKGKNLIIYEIAKRYVLNFLNFELASLKKGNEIKIIAIELDNTIDIAIPELNFPVKLTGKVDRVDTYNGVTRVIDYKTGKVEQNKVEIINWEDLTTDYTKYSKSFQVLCYALMVQDKSVSTFPIEAGIISFKNLNQGFLKFATKDRTGAYAKKDTLITHKTLKSFQIELKKLILEICNPNINFIEKDV